MSDSLLEELMGEYQSAEQTTEETQESVQDNNEQLVDTTESSLTDEPQPEQVETPTFGDEDVYKYLSQKLNTQISSFEDIVHKSSVKSEDPFADESLKVINEYVKNTGRTIDDYFRTQRINLDEVSQDNLNLAKLMEDNPTLTQDEVQLLYEEEYGKKSLKKIDDDMLDDEREAAEEYNRQAERANKLRDIKIKRDSEIARKYFKEVQEQYKIPVRKENISDFDKPSFKEALQKDIKEMSVMQFDLGDEKFVYEVADNQKQAVGAVTPNDLIKQFTKSDGTFDVQGWNSLVFLSKNANAVIKSAMVRGKSQGREALEREMKNTSLGQDNKGGLDKTPSNTDAIFEQLYGNKNYF